MNQTKRNKLAARVQPKRDTVRERGRRRLALNTEQLKAYQRGQEDFARGRRNVNPPYGFSDLKAAWKQGWMAARRGKV